MYVLILIVKLIRTWGMDSIEFDTEEACRAALEEMAKQDFYYYGECFPKGDEPVRPSSL